MRNQGRKAPSWLNHSGFFGDYMLIHICTLVTERLIRAGMLEKELENWCIYWLQKRLLTVFGVLAMFLLGSKQFGIGVTICFLLGLLPLRRRLSGFHTKSPCTCLILSLSIMQIALMLHNLFSSIFSLLFGVISIIICLAFVVKAPIEECDSLLHIKREEIEENHRLAIRTLFLRIFSVFVLYRYLTP